MLTGGLRSVDLHETVTYRQFITSQQYRSSIKPNMMLSIYFVPNVFFTFSALQPAVELAIDKRKENELCFKSAIVLKTLTNRDI